MITDLWLVRQNLNKSFTWDDCIDTGVVNLTMIVWLSSKSSWCNNFWSFLLSSCKVLISLINHKINNTLKSSNYIKKNWVRNKIKLRYGENYLPFNWKMIVPLCIHLNIQSRSHSKLLPRPWYLRSTAQWPHFYTGQLRD